MQNFIEKYHPDKEAANHATNLFNDNAVFHFRQLPSTQFPPHPMPLPAPPMSSSIGPISNKLTTFHTLEASGSTTPYSLTGPGGILLKHKHMSKS
ncbi:hypothetical protein QTO34_017576 [Cnephaeus nilssonii]|uniref:Uncharacterized protein n=1 Tax=Cnephaeus nilssonii TaxID=3371016 RepID=A0AA40LRC9_CNENI|nr:hypothetical protein QTO34_017576 [Eptesicus nilssonii]